MHTNYGIVAVVKGIILSIKGKFFEHCSLSIIIGWGLTAIES